MGQSTPVAAYKISPAPAVVSGQPTTALGAAVGQAYTFILCEESGREMLCGLSPAPAGSHAGDTSLTAVGFATQERSQLLGSCLQFTEQVGDTPVLCTVGVTASMYTVELGDGSVQQVAGEELIRAYTSPMGTFIIRSLHALAVVDITPPRATHFVVGVADENGEVTELVSWALDEASQPTLQQLNESDEAVLLASGVRCSSRQTLRPSMPASRNADLNNSRKGRGFGVFCKIIWQCVTVIRFRTQLLNSTCVIAWRIWLSAVA